MKTNKIIFGGICATVAMLVGANEAMSATTIGSFVVPKPVNGCSPTVVVGEKNLTTGCYILTTTPYSLVNGVCTAGTAESKSICDGAPGAGFTYQGTVADCAALSALTGLSQGDAYYVNGKLFIYDGSSFPTCPEGGVDYQGPAGCTPTIESSSKNAEGCYTITTTPYTLQNGTCTAGTSVERQVCDGETGATGPQGPQGIQGPQGPDMCEGAVSPSTTLKSEVKTYTAHTSYVPGYMTLTSTMCNDSTVTQTQQDTCSAVDESNMPTAQRICPQGAYQYMECINQQNSQTYNICWLLSTQNAQTLSAAINTAQSTADNAQSTATTTANKVDNPTTGLVAAHTAAAAAQSAANAAQTTADSKISKDATFSTSNGYVVLTDGNTTKNVVALADIKGEKGDKGDDGADACQSLSLVTDDSYTGTDGTRYILQCND